MARDNARSDTGQAGTPPPVIDNPKKPSKGDSFTVNAGGVMLTIVPTGKGGLKDKSGSPNWSFTDRYLIQLPDGRTLPPGSKLNERGNGVVHVDLGDSRDFVEFKDGQGTLNKYHYTNGLLHVPGISPHDYQTSSFYAPAKQGPPSTAGQAGYVTPTGTPNTPTVSAATPEPAAPRASRSTAPAGKPASAPAGMSGDVYNAIARAARENNVPIQLALAIAQHESGFNPQIMGDHGTSVGLFQLHRGGELGNLSYQQGMDPYTNASIALKQVGAVLAQHSDYSWGQVAAAAQRPADPAGYAASVNGILGKAQTDPNYFQTALKNAGHSSGNVPALAAGQGTTGSAPLDASPGVSIDQYGYIKALSQAEPDLNRLMTQYANEDLSDPNVQQRLEADIQNTNWWKSKTAEQRKAEITRYQDPGSFNNTIKQNIYGVQQQAQQFMVPMSDHTKQHWATMLATGQISADDYTNYLKEQAKSLFPGLASAIDRGVTVQTYTDPYRNLAANTLNIPPDSIDFMHDPKFMPALFQKDPKTGDNTSMSLADFGTYLRKQPEYAKTPEANKMAAQFANTLLQTFGKIA